MDIKRIDNIVKHTKSDLYQSLTDELIDEIISEYSKKIIGWDAQVQLSGKPLGIANAEQAAYASYYDQMRVELDTIKEFIEYKTRKAKVAAIKTILTHSAKSYGERILEKMAEDDPVYDKYYSYLIRVTHIYQKTASIVESFKQRAYSLNNISKAVVAGVENTIL